MPRNKPSPLRKRITYDREFKLKVVKEALRLPLGRRIRPTCSKYPAIEPCQLRKWIRALQHEAENGDDRGSSAESDPEDTVLPGPSRADYERLEDVRRADAARLQALRAAHPPRAAHNSDASFDASFDEDGGAQLVQGPRGTVHFEGLGPRVVDGPWLSLIHI